MASSKDLFEAQAFGAWMFGAGLFRGIGVIESNFYFRPIVGPSKETYLLIGEPKGLPVLAGSDEDTKQLVGP